jgi:hypothetical protein
MNISSEHPPEVLGCEWALVDLVPLVRGQSQAGPALSRGPAPAGRVTRPARLQLSTFRARGGQLTSSFIGATF